MFGILRDLISGPDFSVHFEKVLILISFSSDLRIEFSLVTSMLNMGRSLSYITFEAF